MIFRLEPTSNTTKQLRDGVRKSGFRILSGRVAAQAPVISRDVGNMLVRKFNSSAVAKALRGQGSEDLPAHFGLSDSIANSLVDGMAALIRASVRISSRSTGELMSIKVQAVERDWNSYLSLPGASYLSYPSNITIPVVRWLLIDPTIDIGAAAYSILFEGEDSRFDARIQKVSRSGRAIMIALSTLGGGSPYVLPSIVSGNAGENFIEMTLGQPGVAQEAIQLLIRRVR